MTDYVVGFAFNSEDRSSVLLVEKQQPDWQRGKLNGVGGKIEPEDVFVVDAMVREFEEETGLKTEADDWDNVFRLTVGYDVIWFYRTFKFDQDELHAVHGKPNDVGETLRVMHVGSLLLALPHLVVSNLQWIIPLARYDVDEYWITAVQNG